MGVVLGGACIYFYLLLFLVHCTMQYLCQLALQQHYYYYTAVHKSGMENGGVIDENYFKREKGEGGNGGFPLTTIYIYIYI